MWQSLRLGVTLGSIKKINSSGHQNPNLERAMGLERKATVIQSKPLLQFVPAKNIDFFSCGVYLPLG